MKTDFELELEGYRLANLEVVYYLPDYSSLLNTFWWQMLDLPPYLPRTQKFLTHWHKEVKAVIKEVRIDIAANIRPGRWANGVFVGRLQ